MSLAQCRVVLVRTLYPGNIGATARVMRNLGFEDLVLVTPEANLLDRKARQMSTHGEDILHRARIMASLQSAVADCVTVIGTSARTGGLFRRQTLGTPEAIAPHLVETLAHDLPAALVFGPEPSGLTNDEVRCCHYLINIPTDAAYPSLNLAQAAAICLYAVRRAWTDHQAKPMAAPQSNTFAVAPFAAQEHMFDQLQHALEGIHFLYGPKADALMHALRHLLGRARMSQMEVDILEGLARQLRWYVKHGRRAEGKAEE